MTDQEAIEFLQNLNVKLTDMSGHKTNGIEQIFGWNEISAICEAIKALEEIQQYRAIGTPEECMAAVEKQTAKKPVDQDEEYSTFKCPICGGLIFTEDRFETHKYCLLCGQKLDWSDKE